MVRDPVSNVQPQTSSNQATVDEGPIELLTQVLLYQGYKEPAIRLAIIFRRGCYNWILNTHGPDDISSQSFVYDLEQTAELLESWTNAERLQVFAYGACG